MAIAVYRTYPPKGSPVAYRLVEDYQFPYRYTFDNLPSGSYYVGALIDVDRTDTRYVGQLQAARDPHAYFGGGQTIVVSEQLSAASIDITLEDPK